MILAAAGGALLTLAHPSATRQFTWPLVVLLAGVWLAPVAAGLIGLAGKQPWIRPPALLGSGLGLLATITLVSALLSPFGTLSLLRIWPTLAGVAAFFWLHHWLAAPAGAGRAGRIAQGLTWWGAGLALVSLVGWRWQTVGLVPWATRNDVPFGHSTYTAGCLLLILPWLVYATLAARGLRRTGWGVMVLVAFLALLGTSSRGGVLAAGAVCAATTGIAVVRARWSRRTKLLVAGLAAGILALAVASNPRLRELARGGGWGEGARESNAQRSAMLEAGWRLGWARPGTGWGPGTVPLAYPGVRRQLSGGVDNVLQLHSTPAQLWATLGLGGVLALALLLTATLAQLARLARQTAPEPSALAAAASVAGYGLFALTDHQLDLPALNALLCVNLALLFRGAHPAAAVAPAGPARRLAALSGGVILAWPLLLTGRDLLARYAYEQSLILFEHGRPDEGREYLETAAQRAPYDPYYRHQLAARIWDEHPAANDPAAAARRSDGAARQLEQSLATGTLQEFARFNLAWIALAKGEPATAAQHFLATVRTAPHRGGAYFGLGLALRAAGDERGAVRAFALEWINDPVSFTAPLWEWPDFAPLRPRVAREAETLLAGLAPAHPTARCLREFWAWWADGSPPPAAGFNAESTAFVRMLAAADPGQSADPAASPYAWAQLRAAWRQPPPPAAFAALLPRDGAFAAALARRAARHPPPDWRGFLTAGLENESALLATLRPARTGYGVLALHPDGPVLTDLYVMQQNRLATAFAAALFPPKGWLPARELLDQLPNVPTHP